MNERDSVIAAVRSDLLTRSEGRVRAAAPRKTDASLVDWVRAACDETLGMLVFLKRLARHLEHLPSSDLECGSGVMAHSPVVRMADRSETPPDPLMPMSLEMEESIRCVRFRAGGRLRLPKQEYEMLSVLVERHGRTVTKDALVSIMWGFEDPPLSADKILCILAGSLRRKIIGHARIINIRGAGYTLLLKGDAAYDSGAVHNVPVSRA